MTTLREGDVVIHDDGRTCRTHCQHYSGNQCEWLLVSRDWSDSIGVYVYGSPPVVEDLPEGWSKGVVMPELREGLSYIVVSDFVLESLEADPDWDIARD